MTDDLDGFRRRPAYSDEIEAGLAEIRRRRRYMWIGWIGFLPAGLLVYGLTHWFDPENTVVGAFGICYMAGWMVLIVRATRARCPRCGKIFSAKWYWSAVFTQSCLHCHLGMDGLPTKQRTG